MTRRNETESGARAGAGSPRAAGGRFLVLVGIDGSGKTSLLSALADLGMLTGSWRDLRDHDLPQAMAPDAPTQIKTRLNPMPRTMFVGGHLVAQYEYLVRPAVEAGTDILLDSYWYKVLAKERLLGRLHPSLTELCRALPVPDAVVFLDVDPRVALRRKGGRVTAYECLGAPGDESFLRFQTLLRQEIMADLASVPQVHRVDADADPGAVLDQVVALLAGCRGSLVAQEAR